MLRWLPYEVLELVRYGKLSYLLAEPNLWIAAPPSANCTGMDAIPLSCVLPLQKGAIHQVQKVAERAPDYFRNDGTPIIVAHSARSAVPSELAAGSSSRSLTQAALLSCCNQQDLADLPDYFLEDLPPNVRKLLVSARAVHESGGRLCTTCRRKMVIPRKQWVEWWSMTAYHAHPMTTSNGNKIYPFLRQQCAMACTQDAAS